MHASGRSRPPRASESFGLNASVYPMPNTPPPVREVEFLAVDMIDEEAIKARFSDFPRSLHAYLNQLPCLRDGMEEGHTLIVYDDDTWELVAQGVR